MEALGAGFRVDNKSLVGIIPAGRAAADRGARSEVGLLICFLFAFQSNAGAPGASSRIPRIGFNPGAGRGGGVEAFDNLGGRDLLGLQSLRSALDNEAHAGALIERSIPRRLDGRVMHKDILAAVALDKPEAFGGVEPFDSSCFFHNLTSLEFLAIKNPPPRRNPVNAKATSGLPEGEEFLKASSA